MYTQKYLRSAEKILKRHFSDKKYVVSVETQKNSFDQTPTETLFVRTSPRYGKQKFVFKTHQDEDGNVYILSVYGQGVSASQTISSRITKPLQMLEAHLRFFHTKKLLVA